MLVHFTKRISLTVAFNFHTCLFTQPSKQRYWTFFTTLKLILDSISVPAFFDLPVTPLFFVDKYPNTCPT